METSTDVASVDSAERRVGEHLWRELARVVEEIAAVLGAHLRERPIACWRDDGGAWLAVGRTRVRLAIDAAAPPPLLGASGAVVRLVAFAENGPPAMLWADPVRSRWTSTETEGEILRLDDSAALDRFFFALMVDASA